MTDIKITENINEYFAYGEYDGIIVKFHKPTSYIHARTVAYELGLLNKFTKKFNLWFKNTDTIEFIEELNNELKITPLSACSKFDEQINSEMSEHPSYFLLGNNFANNFRGYYFHPKLLIYFMFWLSKPFAVRFISKRIEKQEEIIRTQNKEIMQIKYLKGSLKINISDSSCKLQAENYNQVTHKDNSIIIPNLINSINYRDKIYNYIKSGLSKNISIGKNINTFIIKDGVSNKEIIDEIQLIIHMEDFDINFEFNETKYKELLEKYNSNPSPQLKGFIFEFEMSKKYGIHRYADIPKIYLQQFGLTNKDTGIDLIDIPNKILYQCKYYEKIIDVTDSLMRSKSMLEKFREVNEDFQLKIIVKKDVGFTRRFMKEFDDVDIIEEEI